MPYTIDLVKVLFRNLRKTTRDGRNHRGLHSMDERLFAFYKAGKIDRHKSVRVDRSVAGTRSHYFYCPVQSANGVVDHKVQMGWLSCACDAHLKFAIDECPYRRIINARTAKVYDNKRSV